MTISQNEVVDMPIRIHVLDLSVGGVYGSDKPIYQEKQASDDQVSGRTVCKLHILLSVTRS